LFNEYVSQKDESLSGLTFDKADFASTPEFDLNLDLVSNDKTKELLSKSDHLKDLYKVMLGSLRKKRDTKKTGAILTPSVIEDFNNMVDKINKISNSKDDGEFKTFEDYLKLKKVNENIEEDPIESVTEEKILSFNDFKSLDKISLKSEVSEALTVPHKERGKKKVNMIVGRFQPFTLGHVKVFEQLHKQNGFPIVVFTVRGKKVNLEKSPFNEDEQMTMFNKMKKQYSFLEAMFIVPSAAIDTLFSTLRPAYEPILWGFGTDRKKAYEGMINKPEYRKDLDVEPDFAGYEIKRGDDDVSASKVRTALELDDESTFNKMTPKSIHDMYQILRTVLAPIEESSDVLVEKKETDLSVEATSPGEMYSNPFFIDEIVKAKKLPQYNKFVQLLPHGLVADGFIKFVNGLDQRETKEIVGYLYSLTKPTQLDANALYGNPSSPLGQLFVLEPKGVGRGEVAIAWLIKDAEIQGGGESYDVSIKGKKFEVKAYEAGGPSDAIRAGVKAKITNFNFYNELLDTISRIDKLTGFSSGIPKFDLNAYFPESFVALGNKLMAERTSILSGEISKGRLATIQKFYDEANAIESHIKGFSNVILRGPHSKPRELSVVPISEEEVAAGTFTVKITEKDESLTYILSELRRLKYVRDPKALAVDLQNAVDKSVKGTVYIVFRRNKVNIVPETGFKFSHITAASVKFVERDL